MVKPSQRKVIAQWVVQNKSVSIGLACATFGISETCYRYRRVLNAENEEIADWLLQLTTCHKRWGVNSVRVASYSRGVFLLTFLTWSWFAFIRPPVYGKSNAKRYAQTLYQIILKGSPIELSIIADEFSRSVPSVIRYAPEKNKLENTHIQEEVGYANDILLLIADKKFCRAIVGSSPGTVRTIFKEIGNTQKYSISIGIFFKNIISDALVNKDSFLFHETNVYDTGMIGHLKPLSIVMFVNYKMVEEIGEFTSWSRLDSKQWDAEQL